MSGLKDLLRTENLSRADVELILATAADFAKDPLKHSSSLAHKTVAIYMTKPSTRTRLASETAVAHLGGTPIFLRGDELQIGRGETIDDTARIVSQFCAALIIRTYAQSDVDQLGKYASIPVINALTDEDHPTQLLADWMVIREKFGKEIAGRKFVYVGDGNNVANSWLLMGAIMGAHVVAATPSGKFALAEDVVTKAKSVAAAIVSNASARVSAFDTRVKSTGWLCGLSTETSSWRLSAGVTDDPSTLEEISDGPMPSNRSPRAPCLQGSHSASKTNPSGGSKR